MNIQQQINKLQAQLDELKAQAAKCEEPEIDWSKMIGRLVEVYMGGEWRGPYVLTKFRPDLLEPFFIGGQIGVNKARPYQGPTRPNWIEWSGGECPVKDDVVILVEMRCGDIDACKHASDYRWSHSGMNGDILRYTVIEP